MKKIAIFASGKGESAERIIKLFNEGNRVKTVLLIVDNSAVELLQRCKDFDVTLLHIPDLQWENRQEEVAELIRDNDVKLLVIDGFEHPLSEVIVNAAHDKILKVTSADLAPREVVGVLEADLRKKAEVKEEIPHDENPTPEKEWAETLKIQFRPPKIPQSPPVVPETPPDIPEIPKDTPEIPKDTPVIPKDTPPMPSTWLIWSVLVTIFCCFIPGIVAIIFSSQVSSKYYAGDYEGAGRASRNAEIWIIVSVVLGVLAATLYIPFMLI